MQPQQCFCSSHHKRVGHDGSSALDVDAAGAVILTGRRLAAAVSLQLTGALKERVCPVITLRPHTWATLLKDSSLTFFLLLLLAHNDFSDFFLSSRHFQLCKTGNFSITLTGKDK